MTINWPFIIILEGVLTLDQFGCMRLTLNQKVPKLLPPKLLNIYEIAYTSPIASNGIFLELSGQDL